MPTRSPASTLLHAAVLFLALAVISLGSFACSGPIASPTVREPTAPAVPVPVLPTFTMTPPAPATMAAPLPPTASLTPALRPTNSPVPSATFTPLPPEALLDVAPDVLRAIQPALPLPSLVLAPEIPPEVRQNQFLLLFPELAEDPAPEWLAEGLRVTYRAQSATTTESAGAGYVQYDVVAMDANVIVSTMTYYMDPGNGTLVPSLTARSLGIAGVGDFWVSPALLVNAERFATGDLRVFRMNSTLEGKTYQAVRFQFKSGKAEYAWMFEEATGLLIWYSHNIGPMGTTPLPSFVQVSLVGPSEFPRLRSAFEGDETPTPEATGTRDPNRRMLAQSWVVQQRQVRVPWQARTIQKWVKPGAVLRYEGTYGGMNYGYPLPELPQSLRVDFKSVDARWVRYEVVNTTRGALAEPTARVDGLAQVFNGMWLPPEAIAALRDGQVLDRDPVTRSQITATRTSGTVTLTETGPGFRRTLSYATADGVLSAMSLENTFGQTTIVIKLKLTARQ